MRKVWKVMPHLVGALVFVLLGAANGQTRSLQPLKTSRPTSSLPNLRGGNDVVAVLVSGEGLFNIGTADNKALLYDFPRPDFTSHVNVWLDGRLFSNDSSRTALPRLALLRPPEMLADSTIVCRYGFEGMLLEQRLRLEQYSDSTGAIFIQYLLTNPTNTAHEMGLLLELDTKVNANDKTPFLSNFGFRDDEVLFTDAGVPDFLQAFEVLPPEIGLVAKFTLVGAAGTRPDFIAIGDWINLSKVKWDYSPDSIKYNDSAVLLRWDPKRLGPGESRALGTYYGVGEVSSKNDTLTLSVSAPERLLVQGDTLSPNPFSVSALVTNTGFATAHNVQARLVLPADLQLAAGETFVKDLTPRDLASQTSGTATWKIQARCLSSDSLFHMRVEVTSSDAPGNAVTRALHVPTCFGPGFALALQPRSQNLVAGEIAQALVQIDKRGNFDEDVVLDLWPAFPGIAFTFTPSRLRPGASSQLTLITENTLLPGTYSFVVNGRSATMAASDTLTLHLEAAVVDVTPPFTRNHNPAQNARNVLPETAISIEVHDAGTGVDTSTSALVMSVNNLPVQPNIFWLDKNRARLEYQPPQPFRYNEDVRVTLRAQDLANPANEMPEERYTFAIVQDSSPPFITDLQPPRDAARAAPNTEISFHVRDELAGVDSNALTLMVNGITVTPNKSGARHDLFVRYRPPQAFSKGHSVSVNVSARDLSSPPNVMPTEQYFFRVEEPIYDLIASRLQPLGELRAGVPANIAGEVRNALDVVTQPFRVRFQVDGATVKDTLFATMADGQIESLTVPVRFVSAGAHEIAMRADAANQIAELSENNNEQSLRVEILPPLAREFIVRPNPFTPNQDGYNDAVEFNFATLGLDSPGLRIFDVDGVAVLSEDHLRSGVFLWNGRDRHDRELPPGIYLYSLQDRGKNVANGYVVLAR